MITNRVAKLRRQSYETTPSISAERALLVTEFYRENEGKFPAPLLRAKVFEYLCSKKSIYIGESELIVGERGPAPKAVPTYPELTCHSVNDLKILNSRTQTSYSVEDSTVEAYKKTIIPYWSGRSMRDIGFSSLPPEWHDLYRAGLFTEFLEQRAPGHTSLDDKIYRVGLRDIMAQIADQIARIDDSNPDEAGRENSQLEAMSITCNAAIVFAERHADLAEEMANDESNSQRRAELIKIAAVCRRVPADAPRNLHEALQMYWFIHLGTITELNGWDAMNPGRLDQHLFPFFERDLNEGVLSRDEVKELIECLWIKFNNHPAPPKVGVTAQESGTYNDFTNINIGGVTKEGLDGVNEVSRLLLEVIDEIHLLQPGTNIQVSEKTPDAFLRESLRVVQKGYGYPALFNADAIIEEQVRVGKSVEDARAGGASGCVETGCFGKEAYILTGYLNTPKILELALNNGRDPSTGRQIGPYTGDPKSFTSFDELYDAFTIQLEHVIEIKLAGNSRLEKLFRDLAPVPFLSSVIDDCIEKALDYNAGGARYNTSYIQCVGIGTITDSMSAIRTHVFEERSISMNDLLTALAADFDGFDNLRLQLANETPRYGNDDDLADDVMKRIFDSLYSAIDGKPNERNGEYHVDMLPTTCHIYFGTKTGASTDGRHAGTPLSEGISPVQGADQHGPTAVLKSAAKMDHLRTGGTLLNMKFFPGLVSGDEGITTLVSLVRAYFGFNAHHVQFNIVDNETLRKAQASPNDYRDLLVRVAGYSDYFCDIGRELQDEIIARTGQLSSAN